MTWLESVNIVMLNSKSYVVNCLKADVTTVRICPYIISVTLIIVNTVEAPISGHPQAAEIVSITGGGHLPEGLNTKFVWEPGEKGFRQGGRKESCPLMRVSVKRASTVFIYM